MGNANASSGDQFQDLAFPPDYPASVAFVLRNLKNQKDETDAVVNAVRSRVTVLEGIAETSSGRIASVETAVADRVKKSSIQSLDPSTIKLSPASIKEFLVTMVNAMKACFTLALLVPTLAFGGGKDIYGNDLTRTIKLGYVDGDLTTVGDLADLGAANPSVITSVVEGLVHPWARAKEPPSETDPTVPYWAKQLDPPAETDPTVKEWAKADNPPAETDPTVPTWAKADNPPAETDPTVPTWAKADNPPAETDPTVPAWAKQANPPQTMTTNAVDALANSAVVTNALTVATTNRVALLESSKADKDALNSHVENKSNPHGVTAEQVGAVPLVEDANGNKTAVTIGSRNPDVDVGPDSLANGDGVRASGDHSHAEGSATTAFGDYSHAEGSVTTAAGYYSHAEGVDTTAAGDCSHAEGVYAYTKEQDSFAFAWNGDLERLEMYDPYESHGEGTFNINPVGGLNGFYIGEQTLAAILANKADKADISAENQTFSNAVLAVGLNIDTNSVAVLNDIAATFGGFPIEGTATTVGGLLAALAAAIAWLKKNKVGSFEAVGGASATVENGVAKLDDFFTESNSLLNGRLSYSRNATGLKDRAFNTLSFDGTEFNLSTALEAVTPTASGQPCDLLIVATATAATTISFTAGTIKGDKPTIDGSGTWLITLTEYAANNWYCRQIKMEDAA